jgi:predicted RNase H-like HicB family nuclease
MKLPKLTAVIEPGDDEWHVASCPELGIVSQGETPEHAEEMIKEAVELWLECADESEIRQRLEPAQSCHKRARSDACLSTRLL